MTQKNNTIKPLKWLLSQPFIIQLAVLLGKVLPRQFGLNLASLVGSLLGSFKRSPMVKAIRLNQWVIHQQSLTEEELDALPKIVFKSAAKCTFDYFYFLSRPDQLHDVVDFSPEAKDAMARIRSNEPTVVVCPHLSNFDLMGYVLALNDITIQVLSFPNPNASYKMQNHLRESLGIIITPMNLSAFRQARQRLRNGGSIITGLDRPLTGELSEKYNPVFFGYRTNLPVTYVRMAKEAHAPVFIMAATSQPDGRYRLEGSPPIWMDTKEDLETEILHNANKVLQQAEGLVLKYAQQWAMFYPVWPQFPNP